MESNLLMSRRDIVVDTLIGILLLAVALFLVLFFIAALGLALWTVEHLAKRCFPGVVLPYSITLLVVYGVSSLAYSVGHLRHQRWRNAFLSLAAIPVIVSIWFADPHSPFGRDGFVLIWLALMGLCTPDKSPLPQTEFFLGAPIAGVVVAVNSGFVGTGALADAASNCAVLAAVVLLVLQGRRRQTAGESHHAPSPTAA